MPLKLSRLAKQATGDVAVDLGTETTLVWAAGHGVILDEPSAVAVSRNNGACKVLAIGELAKVMSRRSYNDIGTIWPLSNGIIVDFFAAEEILRHAIRRADRRAQIQHPRVLITLPLGSTLVERRKIHASAIAAGAHSAFFVDHTTAAALGAGLDVSQSKVFMIVDIGGGTSDIAVYSQGKMLALHSIPVAGLAMEKAIIDYVRCEHDVEISARQAERIKLEMSNSVDVSNSACSEFVVTGRHLGRGSPTKIVLHADEVIKALSFLITEIADSIQHTLKHIPPELLPDVYNGGIYLSGGGSLLKDIELDLARATSVMIHQVSNPRNSAIIGCARIMSEWDTYNYLLNLQGREKALACAKRTDRGRKKLAVGGHQDSLLDRINDVAAPVEQHSPPRSSSWRNRIAIDTTSKCSVGKNGYVRTNNPKDSWQVGSCEASDKFHVPNGETQFDCATLQNASLEHHHTIDPKTLDRGCDHQEPKKQHLNVLYPQGATAGGVGRIYYQQPAPRNPPLLLVLLLFSAALIVLSRSDYHLIKQSQTFIANSIAPFLDQVSVSVKSIARIHKENVNDAVGLKLSQLEKENQILREQTWRSAALEQQLNRYKKLLNGVREITHKVITGRVIAEGHDVFERSVMINVGLRNGVAIDAAVLESNGLIGRVVQVGEKSARVLLLTNWSSRVPVFVGQSGIRAILLGNRSGRLELSFIRAGARVELGQKIFTSGHGGVFPPGLHIGSVNQLGTNILVRSLANFSDAQFVSVLVSDQPVRFAEPFGTKSKTNQIEKRNIKSKRPKKRDVRTQVAVGN